jgi:hypothetical protein
VKKWMAFVALTAALALSVTAKNPAAAATNIGPKKCEECHRAENGVWEKSSHFSAFRGAHKAKGAKEIAKASGGGKSMRRNQICVACHYTEIGGKPKAGPSCESCHGASSEWMDIHNNTKTPKDERLAASQAAGMIHSAMLYEIAENCNGCHAMQNVDPTTAGKLIDAGHPINGDYELVKYSNGEVRHRFYPPDIKNNKEMSKSQMASMFLTGHAVGLVYATQGAKESSNAKYKDEMQKRITAAQKAIMAVKADIAPADALLSDPSEQNARAFVKALVGKDLSSSVGDLLPTSFK